ncbi:MAG: DUF11 domain-containing protein [Oscillochloris sp.]|nr:DUF11 domain-containing protein [Oscillochloris sp.]
MTFLALIALIVTYVPVGTPPVAAGGSSSVDAGWRPFIEWHATATTGGIPRRTSIKAFVEAGEQIFLGSSAIGYGQGDIVIRSPTGSLPADEDSCVERNGGTVGRINDLGEEQAGPRTASNPSGYLPCVITDAETTAAGTGIWEFDFISPNPNAPISTNPTPLRITEDWAGRTRDQENFWIAAWEVSVRAETSGDEILGRVFANYIASNLGNNANNTGRADLGLDTEYYILTYDGFSYRVDTNGIDPFGFVFFANSEGIVDERGNPIYRSLQLLGVPPNNNLPPGFIVHSPQLPDNIENNDITHKIFFEPPDPSMPDDALAPGGLTTWLLRDPVDPPQVDNFQFTGIEGTPGQAGTFPLSGVFSFEAQPNISYQLVLDTNRSGTFGDTTAAGADRILVGTTTTARTLVPWDGLDGAGIKVPAGTVALNTQLQLFAGEVHFPFADAENNPNGLILERIRDPQGTPNGSRFTIYWDDRYTYNPANGYDFSPCAFNDSPPPPAEIIGARPSDPLCYGEPLDGRSALLGVSSQAGAHRWSYEVSPSNGFGDRRIIDTWSYYPSANGPLLGSVILAEADLEIEKFSSPNPARPGEVINYEVVVTNNGPSDVVGARVRDDVPASVHGVAWSCAVVGGGSCGQASGTGNLISTTVDLNNQAVATFTISGSLDQSASGNLENVATVQRPNDVTDPDPDNNVARNIVPIVDVSDLELNKVISTPPDQIQPGDDIQFTITLRNRGPADATGVEVTDRLPPELSFVSATATRGTYSAADGIWRVGDLPANEVASLTMVATWNGNQTRNTAQISASDQPDPDSTPDNDDPNEDDQSSVDLPLGIADLELTKRVNTPRVNVGQNATFTLELTNRGPAAATGVRVGDRLPNGLAFVRATADRGTYNPASGVWNVGPVAVGETLRLAIEVAVLEVGPFTNIAQVTASEQFDPDSTPNNDNPFEDDQGFASIAGDLADLSLSKVVDDPQPAVNGRIVYTVRLFNDGPSTATNIVVTDRLPVGLTYVSHAASTGTYNPTTGAWSVASLADGANATLTISADVISSAPLVNTAEVTDVDQPDPDSRPGNGNSSEDDQSSATLTPQVADLSLQKTVDNTSPPVNGEVTYTIALANAGPMRATGVQVSEPLTNGLTYVSHTASQGGYNPVTGLWEVGTVGVGETPTLQIRARIEGIGPYRNTAQVSKSNQFDPDSSPNNNESGEDDQSSVEIGAAVADLSVSKRVDTPMLPADGIVTYTIGVFNSGPSVATGVELGEDLPAGAELIGTTPSQGNYIPATNTWQVGTLAVGISATIQVRVRLTGSAPYINIAQVTASDLPDPDSTPNNDDPSEDDQARAVVGIGGLVDQADLMLEKTAVAVPRLPDGVAYVVTLTNQGPSTATGVEVLDKLPAGLRFVGAAPSQGRYNENSGVWTVGTLPSGASVTLVITAIFTTDENVTNIAQVSKSDQFDPDSTPNNNVSEEDDQDRVTVSRGTAITLLAFDATRNAEGVQVAWTTGMELNSAGFHVYRAASTNRAKALRITPQLITARGGASSGASYSFLDSGAAPGVSYYYWLVEIERDGDRTEYGPARVGGTLSDQFRIHLPLLFR